MALSAIRSRPTRRVGDHGLHQAIAEVGEGPAFVRRNLCRWTALMAARPGVRDPEHEAPMGAVQPSDPA